MKLDLSILQAMVLAILGAIGVGAITAHATASARAEQGT